jgi:hypothetical protein
MTKGIKSTGFKGEYWRMRISGDTSRIPCLVKRKTKDGMIPFKNVLRSAFRVEHDGKGEYFGFVLDGNGRYLHADFQVTHNTLLAQTLTASFIKQNCFPLWFSFEVPTRQFLRQFPTVPHLFLPLELKANAMDWVEERILEALQKYNCRCIFIDHLHFLFDLGRSRNPSLDIGQVIRRLKGITIKHEVMIFLLCHTQQPKEGDEGLGYEKIRDSSFVAQESDCVIMIARTPEQDQSYAMARVEFHRRTGVMKEKILLEKKGWWLTEREEENGDAGKNYKKNHRPR